MVNPGVQVPYFLEFFPRLILISECASMQVQYEGGNNTRAGIIIITTFLRWYAHCAPSRFSPNKREICA